MSNKKWLRDFLKKKAAEDIEKFPGWDLQKALPPYPIPELSDTIKTFLGVVRPFSADDEYARFERLANEFVESETAKRLQQYIVDKAQKVDNWAYNWWLDDMYLRNMIPLPINSNPGMAFPVENFKSPDDQLRHAAKLIWGICDFIGIIQEHALPVDRANARERGQPLCMEQYCRLFSCYRYPGHGHDVQKCYPPNGHTSSLHAVVACRGQYFVLDLWAASDWLSEEDVFSQLRRIRRHAIESEKSGEDYPTMGAFTTEQRENWANGWDNLVKDPLNTESLHAIETALFMVCLDKPIKKLGENSSRYTDEQLLRWMLHGNNVSDNACNRWYDKTIQFIVGEDGACGLNYEHSAAEAIVIFQLLDYYFRYMTAVKDMKLKRMSSICDLPEPRRLEWRLDNLSKQQLADARSHLQSLIDSLDCRILRFEEFGRNFPKANGMSPDSFIQVCLQLTFYRLHGRVVSTYESASIRRFQAGRVDNIRGCSTAALEWAKAMTDKQEPPISDEAKLDLLWKAIEAQTEYMLKAILGAGVDNHLLGLKESCAEIGIDPLPEFFNDPLYKKAHWFALSTSQVTTSNDSFLGYGAVVPDGYGVSYNLHPGSIVFCIGSFHHNDETSSEKWAVALEQSLRDMKELISTTALTLPRARLYS